jgi:O-antigen/teichoic acid export membrane protein
VANALNAALPLLLMPLLTRYMSPADYGLLVMFQLLCTFVSSFTGLSIHGAISRQYFLLDKPALATYVANCLLILFASTVGVVVFFVALAPLIERVSQFPAEWFWAVISASFFQFLTLTLLSLWQMEGRALAYGALQTLQSAINVGLLAWLVVGLGSGWRGGALAQVLAFAGTGLVAAWLLRAQGWLRWRIVPDHLRDAIRFGVPLIPHTIGATLIAMTDRVMIANLVSIAEAGVYTVGYQVGLVIALMQNSFNQAWVPWVYARLSGGKAEDLRAIVRFTYLYFAAILVFVVALTTAAPFVLKHLVGEQFSGAVDYVFWIGLGYAFNGMYKMVSVHIFYQSKTAVLAWVTALTAMLNLVFTYYGIKLNGAIGAAQATSLAFFVSFVLTWLVSARVQPMPWNLAKRAKS